MWKCGDCLTGEEAVALFDTLYTISENGGERDGEREKKPGEMRSKRETIRRLRRRNNSKALG